jgi:hypothetical protein
MRKRLLTLALLAVIAAPLLENHCQECHATDVASGGVNLGQLPAVRAYGPQWWCSHAEK